MCTQTPERSRLAKLTQLRKPINSYGKIVRILSFNVVIMRKKVASSSFNVIIPRIKVTITRRKVAFLIYKIIIPRIKVIFSSFKVSSKKKSHINENESCNKF